MKCPHCNSFNKEEAKFCKNCGKPLNKQSLAYHDKFGDSKVKNTGSVKNKSSESNIPVESSGSKTTLIICITVVICALIVAGALVYTNMNQDTDNIVNYTSDTAQVNQSEAIEHSTKSWHLIDSFSGSGTGMETYTLPEGKIKIQITAFPIKNYGTNYLTVYSTTGDSVGVDWNSKSAVKSKSNSMTFDSNGGDEFSIDYYETVSWKVDIYQYV